MKVTYEHRLRHEVSSLTHLTQHDPKMSTNPKTNLLTLPAELRLRIYAYVLAPLKAYPLLKEPPLIRITRQFRFEMMEPYYTAIQAKQETITQDHRMLKLREQQLCEPDLTLHGTCGKLLARIELSETRMEIDECVEVHRLLRRKAKMVEERLAAGSL